MTHRPTIRRCLRAGAATRVLVAGVFLWPPPALSEPVRREHGIVALPNGVSVPVAAGASTCLPPFQSDLRYFEEPTLAPLLEAIDAAMAKQRANWKTFVEQRSNAEALVADAKVAGGEAFGRASLSLFLVTASSNEVGPYVGARGQRLRRLSDEALAALIPEAEKHGAWLRALPTTGRGPIAVPDWSGALDDPEVVRRVYEALKLGGKWPDGKTRGLGPWRNLVAREPAGEKKDFPGLDLGNLGLFQLTILRERLLDAFEEESQAAFDALKVAPRLAGTREGQIAFPSVQATEQGFVHAPATFVPVPAMSADDVRERRAFERRWACLGEASAVLGRLANDFVARYSGQASKVARNLKPKMELMELYDVLKRHPRFGLPMAYRRALLGNTLGFDTGAFATELDSLLRENADDEKFLSAAGRTGFTAPWMIRIVLSGAGSSLADVWTKAKQMAFRNPEAPTPTAVETDQQVAAARDARERRQRERQNAVRHVVDAGRRYGRPLAQAQIDRLNSLSDEEFDLLVDVLHAASGLDRGDQKFAILVNDFLRRLQGLPQRGSPALFAALSFADDTSPFLRLDPSKLTAFELFPPRRDNGRRSDAADEWIDRANLAIIEHFRGILDRELDAYRASPTAPGDRRFPKRAQLFALFDEGFAARYGESLTDRVCGKPPVVSKCDALPDLSDYMAIARFLNMAELALEEKDVLYSAADRGRKPTAAQVQAHLLQENEWVSARLRDLEAWESRCGAAGDRCAGDSFGRERESLFRELYLDAEAHHRALDERIAELSSGPSSAPEHRARIEALDGQRQALNARLRLLETHVFGHHTPDDHARSEIGFHWTGFLDGKGGETGATLTFRCCPKGRIRTMAGIPSKYVGNQAALVNWILEKSIDELIDKAGLSGVRQSIRNGFIAWSVIGKALSDAAGEKPRAVGGWDVGTDPKTVDRMRLHVAYFMLKRQYAQLNEDESKNGFVNAMKFLEHYFGNAAVIRVAYDEAPAEVAALASQLQDLEEKGKRAEIEALVTKLRTGTPAERATFRKLLVYFQPVSRTSLVRAALFAATMPPHVRRAIREVPALADVWENLPVETQREEHARAFVGLVRSDEPSESIYARLKPIADVEVSRRREMAGMAPPAATPPTASRNAEKPLTIHGKFVKAVIDRFVGPYVKAPSATERERLRSTFTPPYEIIEDFFARHGDARSATQSLEQARAYFLWELLKARRLRDGRPLPQAGELAPDLAPLHDPRSPERLRQIVAALEAVVLLIDQKIEMRGGAPSNDNLASIPPEVVLDDAVNYLERAWLRLLASRQGGDPQLDPKTAQRREHAATWAFFRNQLENHGPSRFRYNDESPHSASLIDGKRVAADITLQGLDECEMFLVIHDDSSGRPPRYRDEMRSYRGGEVQFGGLSLRSRNAMESLPPALRKAVSVWCRIDWQPVVGVPEFKYNPTTKRREAIPPEVARLIADVIVNPYPPAKIVRLLVTNDTLRNAYFDDVERYLSDYQRTLNFNCKDMPREKERALRRLSKILAGEEQGTGPWEQPVQGRRITRFRDVFQYAPSMSRAQREDFRRWANEALSALTTPDELASLNATGGMERLALEELRRIDVTDLTDYQKTDCRWKLDPLKHYLALMVVALDEFGDGSPGELAADELRLEAVKGGVLRFAPIHVVGLYREELRALGAPAPTPAPVRDFREMVQEVQALERRAEEEMKKLRPGDPAIEAWRNLGYHAFLLRDTFLTFRPDDFGPLSEGAKQYVLKELPKAWTLFESAQILNKPFPPGTAQELRRLFHEAYQIVGLPVPASMLADRARPGPLVAARSPELVGPPAPVVAFDPTTGTAPQAVRQQLEQIQTYLHAMGRSLTANQRLAILGRDRETNALLLELYEPMVHVLPAQGVRGTADLWVRLAQAGGPSDLQDARRTFAPAFDRVERQRAFDPIAARNTVRRRLREAGTVDGIAVDALRNLAEQRFHEQLLPERLRAIFSDATTSPDALAAAFEGLKAFRDRALVELSATIERELREEVAREVVGAYRSKLVDDAKRSGKSSWDADDEANTTIDVLMEALLLTGDERPLPEQDANGIRYSDEVQKLWNSKVRLAKAHQPFLNDVRKVLGLDPNAVYRNGFSQQIDRSIQALTVEATRGVQDDHLGDLRFLKTDAVPRFQRAYDAARRKGLSPHDAYEHARTSVQDDPLFESRRDALRDAFSATEDARHERWTGALFPSARRSIVAAVTGDSGTSGSSLSLWCEKNASEHWKTWRQEQEDATRSVRSGKAANEWTAFQDRARAQGDRLLARQAEIQRKIGELGQEITRVRRTLGHLAELQQRSEWNNKSITPPREREKVLDLERRLKMQLPVLEAALRSEVSDLERQSALIVRHHNELAQERQRLIAQLGVAALEASTKLGSREQRIRAFASQRVGDERPPDLAVVDRRARALDRYFELRQRAEDIGTALAELGKPFATDDPRVVALAVAAAQDSGGCPVDVEAVREFVRTAYAASVKRLADRKRALDALAEWGIRWDGATLDFSDFRVPPGREIDGVALKKLFDDAAALLPMEGGSPVEAAMARLLQPSPWQAFEAELQARWARIGRRPMFEFTKTPGAHDGAAVLVEMVDGKPRYTFRNLAAVRQKASQIANAIRALAKATPDKMLALQAESNHTLWFLYDPESKRKDLQNNIQQIREKMAALATYGAITVQVSEDGNGSVALPAAAVAFHTALDLEHGTYNSIERLAVELNEDWWWRTAAVGTAVAVIAAAVLTAGMSLPATAAAMLSAAATGAGVGLAANIVETDVLPRFGFQLQGSWSDRGPEMLKTIGVFALGSGLGQVFEAGAVASTTAGRTLMSAEALAAGSVSRIGVARLLTSPIFAHMRGMAYSSMLIDLSLAAKDAAHGYEYSLGDAGRSALHAAQTAFYVWGPDQRFAALARNYWTRMGMSYGANAMFTFLTNTWHYGDAVAKARADLQRMEERKRSEGIDPESDEDVLEMRNQVNKLASWNEYWSTMLRSQLTEAAGNLWFARMAAKTAGQINLQRDLARLSDRRLTRETFETIADRVIVEGQPDILDRLNPRSPHHQGRREGQKETPLEALARQRRKEVDALLDAAAKNPAGPEAAQVRELAKTISNGEVDAFRQQWQDYRRMEREQAIAGLMTQMPQWQVHQLVQSKEPDAIRAVEVLAAHYRLTPERFRLAWQARIASPDFRRLAPLGSPEIAVSQLLTGRDPVIPGRSLTHGEQQRAGAALLAAAEKSIDAELSRGPQWSRREALMGELLRIRPDRVREYRFDLLRNYMIDGRAVAVGEGAQEALSLAAPILGVASPDALAAFLKNSRMPSRFTWNELAQKVSDASGTNPARQVEMLDRREITAEDVGRCFGPDAYRDAVRRLYRHRGVGTEAEFDAFFEGLVRSGQPLLRYMNGRQR